MKRLALVLLLLFATVAQAGPKTWHKRGTQDATADAYIVGSTATPFGPASVCILNSGNTNNLYATLDGTTPTDTDDTKVFAIAPGSEYCLNLTSSATAQTTVTLVTAAAVSTTYIINAVSVQN